MNTEKSVFYFTTKQGSNMGSKGLNNNNNNNSSRFYLEDVRLIGNREKMLL